MAEDELTYEDVIDVWEREKDSRQPSNLPNNFYDRLRGYIQDLEREMEDIHHPPKNKREKRTQKQYQRVKKISRLFFKERQKKIVLAAYHRSLEEPVKTENLTEPELEVLDELSKRLREFKNEVFLGEYKRPAGEKEEEVEIEREKEPEDMKIEQEKLEEEAIEEEFEEVEEEVPTETDREDIEESAEEIETPEEEKISEQESVAENVENGEEILVHITEDVPTFVDMDTTYDLKKEDVLTLREDIAEVLIEREKARKIKI